MCSQNLRTIPTFSCWSCFILSSNSCTLLLSIYIWKRKLWTSPIKKYQCKTIFWGIILNITEIWRKYHMKLWKEQLESQSVLFTGIRFQLLKHKAAIFIYKLNILQFWKSLFISLLVRRMSFTSVLDCRMSLTWSGFTLPLSSISSASTWKQSIYWSSKMFKESRATDLKISYFKLIFQFQIIVIIWDLSFPTVISSLKIFALLSGLFYTTIHAMVQKFTSLLLGTKSKVNLYKNIDQRNCTSGVSEEFTAWGWISMRVRGFILHLIPRTEV